MRRSARSRRLHGVFRMRSERAASIIHPTSSGVFLGCSTRSQMDRFRALYFREGAPEFRGRVEEHLARYRQRFLQKGLAEKARRIAKLTKLFYQLEAEIEFRGATS